MRWDVGLGIVLAVGVVLLLAVSIEAAGNPPRATPPPCTNCVVGTISTGTGTGSAGSDIVYDAANGHLFVSSSEWGSWGMTVINGTTDTVVRNVSDSGRPFALAYDARNGDIYLANGVGDNVTVYDGATGALEASIALPPQAVYGGPLQIVYDPFNGFLDVVQSAPEGLVLIDGSTNQVVTTVNFSVSDGVIAANSINGELYAASAGEPYTNFYLVALNGSTGTELSSYVLNGTPEAITFDEGNGHVYVVAWQAGIGEYENATVTEMNDAVTGVEATLQDGLLPDAIAYDSSNENLYLTNYYAASVSIVNASTLALAGSISTGGGPEATAYDAMNRCLYTVHLEGLVSILAPPGSSCPALPVWAFDSPLVLTAGAFVGLVMAGTVFHSWMVRKEQRLALELEDGAHRGPPGSHG
jgi:YVTN family beta-propeller protein